MQDEEITLNRNYLGALAIVAILILGIGLAARSSLRAPPGSQAAPPSEASALQRFSQENQLRSISGYVSERVDAVAPVVVRVPAYDASGIVWGGDSVLTTSIERPALLMHASREPAERHSFAIDSDSVRRDWVIVVARDAGERVISWNGISGGRATARCGPRILEKFVLSLPPGNDFAGGGVFDLTGRLRGIVVACGAGFAAIPAAEVIRLLADSVPALPDSLLADSLRVDSLSETNPRP